MIPWLTANKAGNREGARACSHFSNLDHGQEQQLQTQPQKRCSGALAEPNRHQKSKQSISQQLMVQFSKRNIHSSPNGVQVARDISLCTIEQLYVYVLPKPSRCSEHSSHQDKTPVTAFAQTRAGLANKVLNPLFVQICKRNCARALKSQAR